MGTQKALAYAAIYLLWGGAYLAVRVLVQVLPAFLVAGLRYTLAAAFFVLVTLLRRESLPSRRQLFNTIWTGAAMLGAGYGVVFWAEKRLASWLVAVLLSTTFIWTYLGECLILRSRRLQARMLLPVVAGFAGMPFLMGGDFRRDRFSFVATLAVLLGAIFWSVGTLAVKRIDMPSSFIQTTGFQLASSGLLLIGLSGFLGEWQGLPAVTMIFAVKPIVAMAYLVIAASMLGFGAFNWLLAHEPPSLVATSAYVNPMVAMGLGIVAAHEDFSLLQLLGACTVLISIIVIWYFQRSADSPRMRRLDSIPEPLGRH
jgi:drug/metabolite transporter (DMT)-like permease